MALSALLDSAEKLNITKKTEEKEETKSSSAKKYIHKYNTFIHMIRIKTLMDFIDLNHDLIVMELFA